LERMQHAGLILRLTDCPWAEPCPGSMRYRVIKWGANDRDICLAPTNLSGIFHPRELTERNGAHVRGTVER